MAAAIVPLIASLVPTVIPLIVRLIDKVFPPKTGASKLPIAASLVQTIAAGLASAGGTSVQPIPDLATITAQVQAVVDTLNQSGQLQGPATAIAPVSTQSTDAHLVLSILAAIAPKL